MELSDDSRKVLREILERQDINDNGTFEAKEFRHVLNMMGFTPTETDMDFLYKHLDVNEDGELQIDEVLENLDVINAHSISGDELMDAFKVFDVQKDGFIRIPELLTVLTLPGPNQMKRDEAEELVDHLLKEYDTDHDRKFSYGEFVRMFMNDALVVPELYQKEESTRKKRKRKGKKQTESQQHKEGSPS